MTPRQVGPASIQLAWTFTYILYSLQQTTGALFQKAIVTYLSVPVGHVRKGVGVMQSIQFPGVAKHVLHA